MLQLKQGLFLSLVCFHIVSQIIFRDLYKGVYNLYKGVHDLYQGIYNL